MKTTAMKIVSLSLALGLGSVLGGASVFAKSGAATKTEKSEHRVKLTGGTDSNKADIENAAKDAGALSAQFNAKSGVLTYSGSVRKSELVGKISEKVPGVSHQ